MRRRHDDERDNFWDRNLKIPEYQDSKKMHSQYIDTLVNPSKKKLISSAMIVWHFILSSACFWVDSRLKILVDVTLYSVRFENTESGSAALVVSGKFHPISHTYCSHDILRYAI